MLWHIIRHVNTCLIIYTYEKLGKTCIADTKVSQCSQKGHWRLTNAKFNFAKYKRTYFKRRVKIKIKLKKNIKQKKTLSKFRTKRKISRYFSSKTRPHKHTTARQRYKHQNQHSKTQNRRQKPQSKQSPRIRVLFTLRRPPGVKRKLAPLRAPRLDRVNEIIKMSIITRRGGLLGCTCALDQVAIIRWLITAVIWPWEAAACAKVQ